MIIRVTMAILLGLLAMISADKAIEGNGALDLVAQLVSWVTVTSVWFKMTEENKTRNGSRKGHEGCNVVLLDDGSEYCTDCLEYLG